MNRLCSIGDRVTFRAWEGDSRDTVNREVNGITTLGPTVRYLGWSEYQLNWKDIIEVNDGRDHTS